MADEARKKRRIAKGTLTKSLNRLNDVVVKNFSVYDIQTRIDNVKDALENSVDKNEEYVEVCEAEGSSPDEKSADWDTIETSRVNIAVREAIRVMKQLKLDAAEEAKADAEGGSKGFERQSSKV